jgi:hypothetical protein
MSDELNPIKQDIIENVSEDGVEPGSQTHNIREHFQILCQPIDICNICKITISRNEWDIEK